MIEKEEKELPAEKIPHQNSSFLSLQSGMISQKKNAVAQRISSARLHKIKELKNEIIYLQHQLEASTLENHLLKQLQYRHSKAIGRYESSESNLTGLLASHYNEVRALRELLRMSQEDERNTSRKLRKVEAELMKAKDALQTLLMLSEDKALAEREDLGHKLAVLTEKLEVNDTRIQSLEKQLKLNNSIFRRQLASENKKAVEAGIITKNLQMEINSLHQKIKEKDRQLHVKNIYANRMFKILKDKSDSVPHEKSLSISRSVQVDKQSFRSLLLSQYQMQETEKSAIQLTKEKKSSEDENQKAKANEEYKDVQGRTEKQSTKKIPKPETSKRTHREYLRESRLLMEEYACLEYVKEDEKEKDLLKQELRKLMKTEQTPVSDSVKENNQGKDAMEEYKEEEKRPDEQLNNSEKARSKCITPSPRNKTPPRLKKKYIFSEATENLHYGLPTPGTKSKKGSLCNHRPAGQECSETAESRVENSSGLYEPSFGEVTKTRQKDSSTEAKGCAHMTFAERKISLMKELFGPGCV
ncbi:PREDICTED: lebercilin-like protein [Calidris pugnax]|uniref:lebercilin-like protein n=1 Tax=Calidris pugnax TaxID=198806 RepID=UPI00071DF3DA|nr:PREDICTED: lebercilin-like protein [Calidris pugnax]